MYEWLFFEQYTHEPAIAVRRSILTAPERAHMRTPERLEQLLEAGNYALGVMERRLSKADWLAGDALLASPTSRSTPTRTMPRSGGLRSRPYPGISAWIKRVASAARARAARMAAAARSGGRTLSPQ